MKWLYGLIAAVVSLNVAAYVGVPILQARERAADHAAVDAKCPASAGYGLMKDAPRDGRTIEICYANATGHSYTDLFKWDPDGDWRGGQIRETSGGVTIKWRGSWAKVTGDYYSTLDYHAQRDGPFRWRPH